MVNGLAALVLAGGEARRMGGGDKPLLRLGGRPLLSHLLDRLPSVPRALSANGDPDRFAPFGLPVLSDERTGLGPLSGLLSGLRWAASLGARDLLTIPGDTPFAPRDLAARLDPAPSVACSAGRRHHLVALWPVGCLTALEQHLRSLEGTSRSAWGIQPFARHLGAREVVFDAEPVDPFFNVNTPDELAQAERLLPLACS